MGERSIGQVGMDARAPRLSPRDVSRLARRLGHVNVGAGADRLRTATSTSIAVPVPPVVHAQLGAAITIDGADLPPALSATLKHAASMSNPVFYERQRRRASTWDTPRFLRSYDETLDGDLVLLRGLLDRLTDLVTQAGSRLGLADERSDGQPHSFAFTASLDPEQQAAHDVGARSRSRRAGRAARRRQDRHRLCDHRQPRRVDSGVGRPQNPRRPVAPPHPRVAGCQGRSTLRRARNKTGGVIDIATLQTLSRRDDVADFASGYGLVVVDECHHVPAAGFEHAVRQIPARRWLGAHRDPVPA